MNSELLVDEVVKEVYKRLKDHKKKNLLAIGTFLPNEITLLEKEYNIQAFSPELQSFSIVCDKVLLSYLSIESLSGIATGCAHSAEEKLILHSLLLNIPVYILENGIEYRKYKKTAHKNLYGLYKEYENKMIQYGITIIPTITDLLLVNPTEINYTSKNLLLETDLLKLKSHGPITLHIKKTCIITPSAADFIKNHNIKLNKIT